MTMNHRVFPYIQVQQASSGPQKFKGPADVVKQLYKEGGIRSIYKGTGATLLRGSSDIWKIENVYSL